MTPQATLDAVNVVLRDMGIDARPWADDEFVWIPIPGESPLGVWIAPDEDGDLVQVADRLQNDISETAAHWAEALPHCPGHTHWAAARRLGEETWWVCPASGQRVAKIGELSD